MTNIGKSDHLQHDLALRAFLSKEIKNESVAFCDYAPTEALVRSSIIDFMHTLGMPIPKTLEEQNSNDEQ